MNSTFMFNEDSFEDDEDFSKHYHDIGGILPGEEINNIIRSVYLCMEEKYPDEMYRHNFPSVECVIRDIIDRALNDDEISRIVDTFAFHEIGYIPVDYIEALHKLNQRYQLAVVIDIWAPKSRWLTLFEESGIAKMLTASSFSSDHGMVKPSPRPFELVLEKLGIKKDQGLVVGDSVRRDLGGALAAGIDCVLVGGAEHPQAVGCYENLLALCRDI